MANNRLILRTVNSPWVTSIPDLTKGSVLTHVELDNNFIHLKGEVIENATITDGITTLHKINGNDISFDNDQNNLIETRIYTLDLTPSGSTITQAVNFDPRGLVISDKTNYFLRARQGTFDLIYGFASGKGHWGMTLTGDTPGTPVVDSDFILLNATTGSTTVSPWESGSVLHSIQAINDSGLAATGNYAVAEGFNTTASGYSSHAQGWGTQATGYTSHAEGRSSIAAGNTSHAEGLNTIASATASHAEGYNTTASGDYSHAEGLNTTASGRITHAEGTRTTASGNYSHSQGLDTEASGLHSHVSGKGFNAANNIVADGETSFAHFEQTTASGNIGAHGDNSAILGGLDHNINTGAHNSAIIGGDGNEIDTNVINTAIIGGTGITATQSNTTYVPRLNITDIEEEFSGHTSLTIDNQGNVKKFETNNFSRTIFIDSDDLEGCISCTGPSLEEKIAQYVNTLNYNKLTIDSDIWIEFHDVGGIFTDEFDEQFE